MKGPLAFAVVVSVLVASLLGCGDGSETAAPPAPPETVTVTVTETVPAAPEEKPADPSEGLVEEELAAANVFEGEYFSVAYPESWELETAEVSKGSYLDTTIRDVLDSDRMLRIDVSPATFSDPATAAAEVEAYLRDQPGYRRLRYGHTSFLGYDAFRWDFLVREDGVLLRKSDIFFTTDAGDGVAVLIQTPAADYRAHASTLETARRTLTIVGEGYAPDPGLADVEASAEFCATHDCIDNFEEGNGSIVQCEDGSWSQSGGIQGACSHHGGVADGYEAPSVGGGYDPNDDGSTYNWCGASRDGDGDGLWCEGRD
jgi:hypothetical protein